MDRLDELALLVAIIDERTMAGAARHLRRSPPAVSRMLTALEDRVGVRLVERTTRRLSATDAGLYLAERARVLLLDYDAATNAAATAPLRGLLRVTAPVQFGRLHVAPVVASFLDAYPSMSIELMLHDRNLDLIEEGLDIAVRIGALTDSSLLARRVGEVTRMLVASPAYLTRRGEPRMPADLAAHDTIFATSRAGAPEWRFGRGGAVRLTPRLLVSLRVSSFGFSRVATYGSWGGHSCRPACVLGNSARLVNH